MNDIDLCHSLLHVASRIVIWTSIIALPKEDTMLLALLHLVPVLGDAYFDVRDCAA